MSYEITYDEKVLSDIKKIPKDLLISIRKAVESRLSERPYDFRPLSGKKYQGLFRLRVGDYRIIYAIDENLQLIKALAIGLREKIYQTLDRRISAN
ncbi:MAG: type II toxin-antitoxin system RelE/ParE family toxin [Holosporales bacterium]|jgi:mRNA interferase RelE/StbE|nr:type II toxin-antitoxin system RelE/ParE family toxin [Holosporales bacterium]